MLRLRRLLVARRCGIGRLGPRSREMPKGGKKDAVSDGSGSELSEDEEDISWIQWFCVR